MIIPETATSKVDKELEHLIKAKYSLLYVVSWEERRVIESLEKICDLKDVNLSGVHVWDSAKGLRTSKGQAVSGGENLVTPDNVLDHIMNRASEVRGKAIDTKANRGPVYVLCDMFRYFSQDGFTPELERKFRVLSDMLRLTNMSVIITSPVLQLPTALEKAITVLDYPMPGSEEMRGAVAYAKKKLVERKRITQADADLVPEENVVRALLGLTKQEADDAMAKAIIVKKSFDIKTILEIKRQIVRKGQLLDYIYSEENLDCVGGFLGLKEFINLRKKAFSDKATAYGLPAPKGIFMLGIQGCGKSLAAKAISNELQVPLLKLDMGRLFGSLMGESEQNIKRAIQLAESVSPCVLFLDEIDKSLAGAQGASTDSGTTKRVIGSLLDWMNEKTAPVFVVAAANSLDGLPAAVLRKGRFDELFFVDLPDAGERKDIFSIHIRKKKRNPEKFDLDMLAEKTEGYSGAEIEAVITDAMYTAFSMDREFDTSDIDRATRTCVPLSTTMKEEIDRLKETSRNRMRMVKDRQKDILDVSGQDGGRFNGI